MNVAQTLVACCLIAAQSAAPTSAAAVAGAGHLDAFLDQVQSLRADFVQTVTDSQGVELQQVSGTLAVRRPGRFRWDYREPSRQVIVADGKQVWMYDEELAQVTVRPLDSTLASTPAMLLSGGRALHEHAAIAELGERDGLVWVEVVPHVQDSDFEAVRIGFDAGQLAAMELVDSFGQTIRMSFANLVRNPRIDDAVFEFEAPAGVDVIGTDDR
ncbi:MAG: outer membrane lipoprotein chaperone LolA [Gammaproteobacteria bacterium]